MSLNLHFYLQRLRHASLPELLYRMWQTIAWYCLRCLVRFGGRWLEAPEIEGTDIEKLRMPELMPGNGNALDGETLMQLSRPRAGADESDIRIRWEPARLQQATALMMHLHRFAESDANLKFKQAAKSIVLSWIRANPFPYGEHYLSAMECALRIPVFFFALKMLDNLTPDDDARILDAIQLHARLISKRLSLYSSAGNHTVTEAVGLVFAGGIYRKTLLGRRWLEKGTRLLDNELAHQILPDGGPVEQSLNYHRFVLDLYWLAMDFLHRNSLGDVHHWQARLVDGESFLSAFEDRQGCFPSIGDSDDGHAVAKGMSPSRDQRIGFDSGRMTFRDTGYSLIKNERLVFTFDHGSLGMGPFFNHGHADALSVTLTVNDHQMIIDPGTYRYNGVPNWRRYFKGTRAHNTVTIDDQDQAVQETSFIWSQPYQAALTAQIQEGDTLFWSAGHNGYTRLRDSVYHQRSVLFFSQANFLIKDQFHGAGMHRFQLNFHFHPDAIFSQKGSWWVVENGGGRIFIRLVRGNFQLIKGSESPLMGWFSPSYGQIEPTSVLTHSITGIASDIVFTTAIYTVSPFESDDKKVG